jgi:hypothetical protein
MAKKRTIVMGMALDGVWNGDQWEPLPGRSRSFPVPANLIGQRPSWRNPGFLILDWTLRIIDFVMLQNLIPETTADYLCFSKFWFRHS